MQGPAAANPGGLRCELEVIMRLPGILSEATYVVKADEERDGSEDAEAGVDEAPCKRNAADGAGDEGEWKDADTSDHSELEHPLVAHGIDPGAEERYGENKVGEGEPVCAVGKAGIADAGVGDGCVYAGDPGEEGGGVLREVETCCEVEEVGCFRLEREGGDAAEDEADHEDCEPEADGASRCGAAWWTAFCTE